MHFWLAPCLSFEEIQIIIGKVANVLSLCHFTAFAAFTTVAIIKMKKLDQILLDCLRSQNALQHFANEQLHQPEGLYESRSLLERVPVAERML